MTAKEWLSRAYYLNKEIESKMGQIALYKDLLERITVTYTDMPKYHDDNPGGRLEKYAIEIADLRAVVEDMLSELLVYKKDLTRLINCIDDSRLRVLLELRYITCCKWEDIAEEMGYTEDHVKKTLFPKALRQFEIFWRNSLSPTKSHGIPPS